MSTQPQARLAASFIALTLVLTSSTAWAKSQTFDSAFQAAADGWTTFDNTINGNNFGFR